ncbi:HAD hydrolase family protein [bacterium]|nr:HAD hydrolase family protein [bacterium]
MSYLSQNLLFLRQEKGLKPEGMARQLGIWENTLRQYELGREEPDMDTLILMSDKLNLPIDHLLRRDLQGGQSQTRRKNIKLMLFDVDGTLTDGGMYYSESGEMMKKFNTKDGMAISRVSKLYRIKTGLVSAGIFPNIIQSRADTLGMDLVYAGKRSKISVIEEWLKAYSFTWKQVLYAGDDINDIGVMQKAGLSACPADAVKGVKAVSNIILTKKGGDACIRELIEDVLEYDLIH